MKVTVCELPDARSEFDHSWALLLEHVAAESSDLVLLPAMPFATWCARAHASDFRAWSDAVRAHDAWETRLKELAPALVAGTRPSDFGSERYVQAFVWVPDQGFRSVHAKSLLPDSSRFSAASWYDAAAPEFVPQQINGLAIGFLLDEELRGQEEAARYGAEGAQLLLAPRCTDADGHWLDAARDAAVAARAYQLSSNRMGSRRFGGTGWIIDPEGNLLATTDRYHPFLTLEIEVPWQVVPGMDSIWHTTQTRGYGELAML